ncbi:helix-turn-helix domain-containing protein [Candidatus Soleaferrea massiliensis]|uniref:helix-turn-helix domain-containing protein n=1 Tax=Candidatus Soleaferrea massiliensis TaxID=1470354 RepID=UPI0005910EDE|nr:helix-turn-helix transcriptional regulator [Candidatus Soleaferrea massiliensis]
MLERIRNLREDRDMTQKELSALLFVSRSTYSAYELGKVNVPAETLRFLALFFDTSVDYLLELTDNPTPYRRKQKKGKADG